LWSFNYETSLKIENVKIMEERQSDEILALIARNLAGMADANGISQLNDWIGASEDNKLYYEQIRLIWDTSDNQKDINIINTPEAMKKVFEKIPGMSPKRTLWYYWQKIAAVIIIPLSIGTFLLLYLNSQKAFSSKVPAYNEVFAAFGTRSALKLEDSTLVWLNSGSSLRYPDKFIGKNRIVYLKGEAYFEVKSDDKHPFIVKTSTLQVQAKGTKFNVLDYDTNPVTEVTLVAGKVVVERSAGSTVYQLISELKPDQHLEYNKLTNIKELSAEDVYKYYAWKDGKMIFRNEPLSAVVNKIGQTFNVDIELQGKDLQDFRYRATFQDESLEEVLKLLKLSSPVDFLEIKRNPLPDGSFRKKRVIIFPAKPD
jgi:transmembrane sensor